MYSAKRPRTATLPPAVIAKWQLTVLAGGLPPRARPGRRSRCSGQERRDIPALGTGGDGVVAQARPCRRAGTATRNHRRPAGEVRAAVESTSWLPSTEIARQVAVVGQRVDALRRVESHCRRRRRARSLGQRHVLEGLGREAVARRRGQHDPGHVAAVELLRGARDVLERLRGRRCPPSRRGPCGRSAAGPSRRTARRWPCRPG